MKMQLQPLEIGSLGIAQNIPKELTSLRTQNTALIAKNEKLNQVLVLMGLGIGVYVLIQLIKPKHKDHE